MYSSPPYRDRKATPKCGRLHISDVLKLDARLSRRKGVPHLRGTTFSRIFWAPGGLGGSLCGRRMYEVMRYWDEDQPEWEAGDHDFAAVWRALPKWVVSRSLKSVGANATLVAADVEEFVPRLKSEVEGEIDVAGPELAGCLTDLGLIDEYRLYIRPFVLGRGKSYFAGARPPLRLIAADPVGEDAVRLTYVPT